MTSGLADAGGWLEHPLEVEDVMLQEDGGCVMLRVPQAACGQERTSWSVRALATDKTWPCDSGVQLGAVGGEFRAGLRQVCTVR